MITGNPMDRLVVVESSQAWEFASETNSILQQEPLFYIESTYIDAYMYKAILVKRDVEGELVRVDQ